MSNIEATKLFILGIEGYTLNLAAKNLITNNSLAGVILFKHNINSLAQVVELNGEITNANKDTPPLICVDQEGGRVARLRGICTDIPPMAQVASAAKSDPALPRRLGAMMGRELASLGFTLNFAPVCDVAHDSTQEIIGDRSFSDDSSVVATLSAQMIKGMQGAGVAACAKHFPGHGATIIDSHFALPQVDAQQDLLTKRELVPFVSAIDADVASVMSAHIIYTALDATTPATMSAIVMENLLRRKLGYRGVIISDDLDMKAVADNFTLAQILERSLMASVDLFIIGNNFAKGLEAIKIVQHLIDTNDVIRAKATQAIERIDTLRAKYLGKPLAPNILEAQSMLRCPPHLALIKRCV